MADTSPSYERSEEQLSQLNLALASGRLAPVRRIVGALHSAEIAHLLESLPQHKRQVVWRLVDADTSGEVLVEVGDEVRAGLIEETSEDDLITAAGALDLDDLADILDDLPDPVIRDVLASMDNEDRERLTRVLSYPEDTAGGLMNPEVITVRGDVTLGVVIRYLRGREGDLPAHLDQIYVVSRGGRYLGAVPTLSLALHDPHDKVSTAMDASMSPIALGLSAADVATEFEHRDMVSAPVVDDAGFLLGEITVDDVVDVIREQAEHSVLAAAGLDQEEDMFAPVPQSARRRAVWLGINLLTAFLAAWVIGMFEGALEQVVALAILMPVVASMGGIAGSQTLTLMIRGMAIGQVGFGNARALLRKELLVGLVNSVLWALVVAAIALAWFRDWDLGAVIAAAIAINLVAAAIAGVVIPLVLKRMEIDPALAGGVVLTTVTDVVGFVSFLGLGTVFLL